MAIELDPSPQLSQYAHPNKLVTNSWLGAKLGSPGLKVIECDEDTLLYDIGHVPTAIKLKWSADLSDPLQRDVITAEAFAELMDYHGISREDTVVIYGDHSNRWAVYTLWIFELFGHPDVRLLDGGRDAWMQEEREISYEVPTFQTSGYPVVARDDATNRIFVDELRETHNDIQVIDLRSQAAFSGADAEASGKNSVSRAGHIPGAKNLDPDAALFPNARFRQHSELSAAHAELDAARSTVVYCGNGARAAQEWFVLKYLLGWDDVRVYDGSWVEWGNMVRVPIER